MPATINRPRPVGCSGVGESTSGSPPPWSRTSIRIGLRERIATYFDPLPFWYSPLEDAAVDLAQYL